MNTLLTHSQILQRFGTPLKQIPAAGTSAQWPTWQKFAGIAIVGLALYGAYSLYTKVTEEQAPKVKKGN
ncbi:MAG: hypothetical protein ACXVDZ_14300 [Bacteroidia bacterium]